MKKEGAVFKLYFADHASLDIFVKSHGGSTQKYVFFDRALKSVSYEQDGSGRLKFTDLSDSLTVQIDDQVNLRQGAHDQCTLNVQKSGIEVQALNTLPGRQPQLAREHIAPDAP